MMLFLQAYLFYNFLAHFFINLFCTQPFTTNFKSTGPVAFRHACLGYIRECQSVCDWRWPTWPRRTWPRTIRVKQIIFITDLMTLRIRCMKIPFVTKVWLQKTKQVHLIYIYNCFIFKLNLLLNLRALQFNFRC